MRNAIILWCASIILSATSFAQSLDSGEEYAAWKASLTASRAKETMLLGPIQNRYVAVQVNNTIGSWDDAGAFNIGASSLYAPAPNATLVYAYPSTPSTSHSVFQVDGSYYSYSDNPADFPGPPTRLSSPSASYPFAVRDTTILEPYPLTGELLVDNTRKLTCGWNVGGLIIIQNLIPVYVYGEPYRGILYPGGTVPAESLFSETFWSTFTSDRVDTTGSIMIQYVIFNPTASDHTAGVMIQMDTMIGSNDAAPLATTYGYNAVEWDYTGAEIPSFWYAGEDDPPWGPTTLVAQGILSGLEATIPDRFLVGSWGNFNNVTWDYTSSLGPYGDSAIMIFWNPRPLAPNDTITYTTYLGIKLSEHETPFATISYPADSTITACANQLIRINCTDNLGVDTSGFAISINGHILKWPQHMTATWTGSDLTNLTFTINPPTGFYESGDTVKIVAFCRDFFGNISPGDTITIFADLIGPLASPFSFATGETLDIDEHIRVHIEDDYTGIDSASILVGTSGVLSGSHVFAIGDGSTEFTRTSVQIGDIDFTPAGASFAFAYDDSIHFGIARCNDLTTEDFCGANRVQANDQFFFTPDDDTLNPSIASHLPIVGPQTTPFNITINFDDLSGVATLLGSGIYDGTGTRPTSFNPYINWRDTTTSATGTITLVRQTGNTFITTSELPAFDGGAVLEIAVHAFDDDFDREKLYDALPVIDSIFYINVSEAPTAELASPPESTIVSCEDQVIIIHTVCATGLDTTSINLSVNGRIYTIADPQVTYNPATGDIQFDPAAGENFNDGAIIIFLQPLRDVFGASGESYTWYIFADLTPPYTHGQIPEPNAEIATSSFDVSFAISDTGSVSAAIAGLDTSSVNVYLINADGTHNVTAYTHFATGMFTFNTDSASLSFIDNERITIRVVCADDIPETTWCTNGANSGTYEWHYTMASTPCEREPNPITPERIDGYNDYVVFRFPNMRTQSYEKKIFIYDRYNRPVREITEPKEAGWLWDGTDENDTFVPQGVYVYVIVVDGEAVCNGTISVAR